MDGGAWWTAVYGVAQSQTRLMQQQQQQQQHIQDLVRDRVDENPEFVIFKFMISNPIVTLRWDGGCLTIISLLGTVFRLTEGNLSYFHFFSLELILNYVHALVSDLR